MVRCARTISPTNVYHIMNRGIEKRNIFIDDGDKIEYLNIVQRKKKISGFKIYAFCIMDNHAHLLLHEYEEPISIIMKRINTAYAVYFNKKYDRVGPVFQGRFRSEAVDNQEYLLGVVKYIHNNPIKAHIANDLGDYNWSSYKHYINNKYHDDLLNKDFLFDILGLKDTNKIKDFMRFSKEEIKEDFMDFVDINKKTIHTKRDAMSLIDNFLKKHNISLVEIYNHQGNIKGTIKHDLITILKNKTTLSCRVISDLIGTSKSTVSKL